MGLLLLGQCLGLLTYGGCTSGSDYGVRNKDAFDEAKSMSFASFTATPFSFDGGIAAAITTINALTASGTADSTIADTVIEGVVTIPSDYAIGLGSNPCSAVNQVYTRSFVIQDSNAGVLVAYGLEPPKSDVTTWATSMQYINNARNGNMAVFGDRVRLTATRAQKYGSGANTIPVVTDFKNMQIVSSRNGVAYQSKSTAFSRAADLYQVRQLEGYVKTTPTYEECSSGARQFQYNYQQGYKGVLCVGAISAADAQTCSGLKVPIGFQLSKNLGSGTLSGFDTGNSFSYTIAVGAKVRITGPIFPPEYNQGDSNLHLMLSQKIQVETLK